jgi:hypothetical protein
VRDPDPPATSSRTSNIDSALARIAALDQELEVISQVQGAEESIFEAQERATASSSVRAAEQAILDMDTHIQEAHSFQEYPSVKPGTKQVPTPSRTSMRAAFRMSLVFGPPKAME